MNLGNFELVIAAVMVVVLGLIVRTTWLGQRRWRPEEWARELGLELTPRNESFVRSYIARTRTLRLVGGLLGFLAPIAYGAVAGEAPPAPVDFAFLDALAGYLIGAVLAEITVRRPKTEVPTALLVPRDLSDYLPHMFTTALRATAAGSLALVLLYRVLPARENVSGLNDLPPEIVMIPMILVILVGVELLQRYIVGRPQPVVESDLVNADDAVRSASVHALAGAGIALELLIVSVQIISIASVSDIQLLRWILPWIGLVCLGVSLGSWIHLTRPDKRHELGTQQGARA